jgi:hypothetical protein
MISWLPSTLTLPAAALAYASHAWPVFPCARDKSPLTGHGFADASTDLDRVRAWWRRWPDASIGWPIGGRLIVVDVDPRHGGDDSFRALGPWPKTLTARTGGGGAHLIFELPEGVEARQVVGVRPGLDTRAAGKGYIILAPSLHPSGGRYSWSAIRAPAPAPTWFVELICAHTANRTAAYVPPVAGPGLTRRQRYGAAVLRGEALDVAAARDGTRNARLFRAWKRCAEFKDVIARDEAERALTAAALSAGLPGAEIRRVLR